MIRPREQESRRHRHREESGERQKALRHAAANSIEAAAASGTILAFVSNAINNLPAGLVASDAVKQAHPPKLVIDALQIGVDIGPNLSITGSLATILWLQAIRREGEDKVGAAVMIPDLAAALDLRLLLG